MAFFILDTTGTRNPTHIGKEAAWASMTVWAAWHRGNRTAAIKPIRILNELFQLFGLTPDDAQLYVSFLTWMLLEFES
jgi:hypothetical protein